MKAALGVTGLNEWLEQLATAGEDVDEVVGEVLEDAAPLVESELVRNLQRTSEEYTGETAATIEVSDLQKDGNYVFIEATAGGAAAPQAFWKEFGRTRQAAEPFFRPTFKGHILKNKIKATMQVILQRYGLQK
jgi:HK97 gp10 family phage protein